MPQANSLRNRGILNYSKGIEGRVFDPFGARVSLTLGGLTSRLRTARLGWRAYEVSLQRVSSRSAASDLFFPLLDEQDQVPARERYPLVLQLDTFVETTRRKPPLRGPGLHVL